eukprot:4395488-Amphidinium_carterae.1
MLKVCCIKHPERLSLERKQAHKRCPMVLLGINYTSLLKLQLLAGMLGLSSAQEAAEREQCTMTLN